VKAHEGVCTCPLCCPDKWMLNRLVGDRMHSHPLSQTGMASNDPEIGALAEILSRLYRIEAILAAHFARSTRPDDL
jgi:hypothetical protein